MPSKYIFEKSKGEIKMILDIQKLKELIISSSVLQKMLKDIIQTEGNGTRWKSGSTTGNEEHLK